MNDRILLMIGIGWLATTGGAVCLGLYGKDFAASALVAGGVFMTGIILGRTWERPCDCGEGTDDAEADEKEEAE